MSRKRNSRSKGRGRKEKKVFSQVEGRVQMTREGFAFIIVEGEEDDVFVKASKTRGALNGDVAKSSARLARVLLFSLLSSPTTQWRCRH